MSNIFKKVKSPNSFKEFLDKAQSFQAMWIFLMGETKTSFLVKTVGSFFILILSLYVELYIGPKGKTFSEALYAAGTMSVEGIVAQFFSSMFLMMYWLFKIFPYAMVPFCIALVGARMYSEDFWLKVDEFRLANKI